MKIAVVGCGYVFDIYMRTLRAHPELTIIGVFDINSERSRRVGNFYKLRIYGSYEAMLADSEVDAVINLTSIQAHFAVTKQALEAGKHVYSEKPLTKSLNDSAQLFDIAREHCVRLYAAPCNIYSDMIRTIYEAVGSGAIGKPRLIYAELDDNPIHLLDFDRVISPTGAPWPLEEELREGCTYEHLGYHLVWICGLLGPAVAVTAYSSELVESKVSTLPPYLGTPDYSVACLHFRNGESARITCSFVAPRDHRLRVIGDKGELAGDSYRHYRSPVYLEQYTKMSLNARKFQTLRAHPMLGRLFGVGGKRLPLVHNWKSHAVLKDQAQSATFKQRLLEWVRRREIYAQDKFIGIAEMAREIREDKPQFLSPDFLLHVNELTLIVQAAGPGGIATKPTTTFAPLGDIPGTLTSPAGHDASCWVHLALC
ncbi:gfo/Idh/MocA family oxidoreductase [Pseudorhizobium halotolerans]|uniref:Gfo/Idh/MocA family oxidoreductase n=1 Tax=Pseudorhizobium halotolerans TaxID=1233081 RepID=A0ABM8PFG6_9HYPH|nr:Gfo/Idh/MocA family oxidoreductase [Pseudorhizobium halotolerans]CAD7026919.1 gfo/Idh/MocA family oxidoreductase [Pseudorhizobium halotolerans]